MIKVNKKDLARLNSKLRQIATGSEKDAERALKYFINQSVKDIKMDAPVDTGNLKRNIKGEKIGKLSGYVESIALSEGGFDYAPVQEFGAIYETYKREPNPYFYPNIRSNIKKTMALLRSLNKRTVKR